MYLTLLTVNVLFPQGFVAVFSDVQINYPLRTEEEL